MSELHELRRQYMRGGLTEPDAGDDPLALFRRWLAEAIDHVPIEPHAMTLATAGADDRPAARTVLLRGFDERGFVFYTNQESGKGRDLAQNPSASLLFWWGPLERQVRIDGDVERVSDDEADRYFATRPRGHQLAAWASSQSRIIPNRDALEQRLAAVEARHDGKPVPRPPYWGGYRVSPTAIEFWQGRENRLHDRLRYTRDGSGWRRERLAP
jgi:pyridoxamine 5'-phosphate oxidase